MSINQEKCCFTAMQCVLELMYQMLHECNPFFFSLSHNALTTKYHSYANTQACTHPAGHNAGLHPSLKSVGISRRKRVSAIDWLLPTSVGCRTENKLDHLTVYLFFLKCSLTTYTLNAHGTHISIHLVQNQNQVPCVYMKTKYLKLC